MEDSLDYFYHEVAIVRERRGEIIDTFYCNSRFEFFKKGRRHYIDLDGRMNRMFSEVMVW
jgi:hypothetical protein